MRHDRIGEDQASVTSYIVSFKKGQSTRPLTQWAAHKKDVVKSPYLKVADVTYARLDIFDDVLAVEFRLRDFGSEVHQSPNLDRDWFWVEKAVCLDQCGGSSVHETYWWITWSALERHPWEHSGGIKGRITCEYNKHLIEDELHAEQLELRRIAQRKADWETLTELLDQFDLPVPAKPTDLDN